MNRQTDAKKFEITMWLLANRVSLEFKPVKPEVVMTRIAEACGEPPSSKQAMYNMIENAGLDRDKIISRPKRSDAGRPRGEPVPVTAYPEVMEALAALRSSVETLTASVDRLASSGDGGAPLLGFQGA
jgi:hypothetical protein